MKKVWRIYICFIAIILLSGDGYKGTLPDLNIQPPNPPQNEAQQQNNTSHEIFPIDKLTIPIKEQVKTDKVLVSYQAAMTDILRQLERLKEVLDTDKSFKNYVAAANVLDLTTQNILSLYKESRFKTTNTALANINHDTQQIKEYWIKINKNSPYISHCQTNNTYSQEVLNIQLNKFAKIVDFAIRDIKQKLENVK